MAFSVPGAGWQSTSGERLPRAVDPDDDKGVQIGHNPRRKAGTKTMGPTLDPQATQNRDTAHDLKEGDTRHGD
jgi:hypothetical protein